jgi:hypothetical protein
MTKVAHLVQNMIETTPPFLHAGVAPWVTQSPRAFFQGHGFSITASVLALFFPHAYTTGEGAGGSDCTASPDFRRHSAVMFSRRKGRVPPSEDAQDPQASLVGPYMSDTHSHSVRLRSPKHAGHLLGVLTGLYARGSHWGAPPKGDASNFGWMAVSVFVCLSFGTSLEGSGALGFHHGVAGGFAHAALYVPFAFARL